jgi:hypothetical protein
MSYNAVFFAMIWVKYLVILQIPKKVCMGDPSNSNLIIGFGSLPQRDHRLKVCLLEKRVMFSTFVHNMYWLIENLKLFICKELHKSIQNLWMRDGVTVFTVLGYILVLLSHFVEQFLVLIFNK